MQSNDLHPELQSALENFWKKIELPFENKDNFSNLEELFTEARNLATFAWKETVLGVLTIAAKHWSSGLAKAQSEIVKVLNDPNELEKKLRIRQLGILEPLREILPGAWQSLLLMSSERQLAEINQLSILVEKLSDSALIKLGVSKFELRILVEISQAGKWIDAAYRKQTYLADNPNALKVALVNNQDSDPGLNYLYEDENGLRSYIEIFAPEFSEFCQALQTVAKHIREDLTQGMIPESYQELANFLEQMTAAYGSKTKDPAALLIEWQQLYQAMRALALGNCPILIIPQACASVARSANKIDAEMRVGWHTPYTKDLEIRLEKFRTVAENLNQEQGLVLEKKLPVPPAFITYQVAAFGPNVHWQTRGEADEEWIVSHPNVIWSVSETQEIQLLKKVFTNVGDLTNFSEAAVMQTVTHEFAHAIVSRIDDQVKARVGQSPEQSILEELKAETVNALIMVHPSAPTSLSVENQNWACLGGLLDFLINKSSDPESGGERYYYSAVAIITMLLKANLLVPENKKYFLTDHQAVREKIQALGQEILHLYASPETTPATVVRFVLNTKNQATDKAFLDFLQILKTA